MSKGTMQIVGQVEGLELAIKKLKAYDDGSGKKIRKAVSRAGRNVASQAKFRVPSRTGKLKKSISARFDSRNIESVVKASAPHAHLVEYGVAASAVRAKNKKALRFYGIAGNVQYVAKGGAGKGTIKIPQRSASPFMEPAYRSVKPRVEHEIAQVLKEMPK